MRAIMGRLSPFEGGLAIGLAVIMSIAVTPSKAAPVQETSVGRYANEKGCYYFNKHYPSGENIHTNEPCLNCTCVGSTLMCYLRVCPMVKPLGANCKSVMHVGDCCPQYWCPEAYPRSSTEKPETEVRGCYLDDKYYDEGARIPMDPMKPCEVCYCIRNTSVCTTQQCELKVDGCFPQYKAGMCCPSRYNCTEDAATTIPPGIMEPEEYEGCKVGGVLYKDGEQVPSLDECENCYCMKHEVVCAVQECKAPADNCVPQATPEGQCCPDKYDCPSGTEIPEWATTHMVATEDLLRNVTTPVDLEPKFTSTLGLTTPAIKIQDHTLFTQGDLDTQTLSIVLSTVSDAKTVTEEPARRVEDQAAETTTSLSELFTETVVAENATLHPADLVSRPREPKITEVPDEMFSSVTIANVTTGRPIFYRPGIPGEGICRQNDVIYQNREEVPSTDPCRLNCRCVNSVIKCHHIECMLSPPGSNCKVTRDPEECCPRYVCDTPADISTASDQFTHIPTVIQQEQEQITISDISKVTGKEETTISEKAVTSKQEQEEITFKEENITESAIKFTTLSSSTSSPIEETAQKEVDLTPTVMSFTPTESDTEISETEITTVVSEVPVMTGVKSTESTEAPKFTDIEQPTKATGDDIVEKGIKEETTIASTVRSSTITASTVTESPKASMITEEEEIFTTTALKLTTMSKESSEGILAETTSRSSEELATESEIKADATKATSTSKVIPTLNLTTEEAVTSKSTVEITEVEQENGTERIHSLETETSTAITTQTTRDSESVSRVTVEDAEPSEVTKLVSEGMSSPTELEMFTQETAKETAFEESTSTSITEEVKTSDATIEEKEKVGIESTTVQPLVSQTTKATVEFDSTPKSATEMSTAEDDISESVSEELKTEKVKDEGSTPEIAKEHAVTEAASKLTTVETESTKEITQSISEELSTGAVSVQSLAPQTAKDTTIIRSTPETTTETSVSLEQVTKAITDSISTESVETETVLAGATTVLESASKIVTEGTTPSEGTSKTISDELSSEEVKTVTSDLQTTKESETEESKSTTKSAETSDEIIKDKVEVSTESVLIIQDTKTPSTFDSTPRAVTAIPAASEGMTESVSAELGTEKMKDEALTSETAVTELVSELATADGKSTKQVTQTSSEELSTEIMEIESLTPEIAKEISGPNVTIQAEISSEEVTKGVTERLTTESMIVETSEAQSIETTSVTGYASKFETESTQSSEKTTKPVSEASSTEGVKVETVTSQTTKEPETLEIISKVSTENIVPSTETTKVTSKEMVTDITQNGTVITELTTAPAIISSTSKLLTTEAVSYETTTEVTEELSLETLEPESIVPETAKDLEITISTPKSTSETTLEEATKSISVGLSTESLKTELFTPQTSKEPGSLESELKSTVEIESTDKTTKITTQKASTEISEDETISLLTTKEPVSVKPIITETAIPAVETTKSVSQEASTEFADVEATTIPVILDSTLKLTTGDVASSDEALEAISKDISTESVTMESFTSRVTKEPDTSKLTTEEAEPTIKSTKVTSIETIEVKSITPPTTKESVSESATKLTTESAETVKETTKVISEETSIHSVAIETMGAETTEVPKILDLTTELTTETAESLEVTKAVSVDLEAESFTPHSAQDSAITETKSELAPKETEYSKEPTSFVSETTSANVSESFVPQTGKETTTKLTTKAVAPLGQTTKSVEEESIFTVGAEIKETETTKVPPLLDFTSKLATETTEFSKEVTKPVSTDLSIEGFESSTEHAVTEFTSRLTTERKTPIQEATKIITEDISTKTFSPQTVKESTVVTTPAAVTTVKSSSMGITTKDISEERSTFSADTEIKEAETTKPTVLDISSKLTIKETEISEATTSFSKDLITERFETESVTPQTTKESTVIGFTPKLTTVESAKEFDVTKISEDTSLASQTTKEPIVIESTVKLTTKAALEETTKSVKEDRSTFSVVTETVKTEATKASAIEDTTPKFVTDKAELPEELTEIASKDLSTESMVIESFTTQTSRESSTVELTTNATVQDAKAITEMTKLTSEEVSTAESVVPQTAKKTIAAELTTKLTTEVVTVLGGTTKAVTEEPSTHSVVSEILETDATKSSASFDSSFNLTTEIIPSSEEVTKADSTDLSPKTVESQSFTLQTTEAPIIVESTSKLTVQKTEVTEETTKLLSEEISTETVETETTAPQAAKEPELVESTTKLITEAAVSLGEETKSISEEVTTASMDTEILQTEATKPPSFAITSKLGTGKTEPSEITTEISSKNISTKTEEFELSTSQTTKQPIVVDSTTKLTVHEAESSERTIETSIKDISTKTTESESAAVESTTKLTIKEAESTKIASSDVSAETTEAESITPQTTEKPSVSKSTTKLTTELAATVSETTKVISEETSIHTVDIETLEAEVTKLTEKFTEEPSDAVSVDVSSTTSETISVTSQTSKEPLIVESTAKLTTEVSELTAETAKSISEEESASTVLEAEATKVPGILEFTSTLTSKEIESSEQTKAVRDHISTESIMTESFRPQTVREPVIVETTSELIIQDAESTTEASKTKTPSIKPLEDETIVPQTSAVEVTSQLTMDAMKTSIITESTYKLTTEATVLSKEITKDVGDDAVSTESEEVGTFVSETTKAPIVSEFGVEESSTKSLGTQSLASETTKEPAFVQDTSKLTTEATQSVTITPTSVESSSHLASEVEVLTERTTKFISTEASSESDEALKSTIQTTEEPEIISSTFKLSSKESTVVPLEETRSVSAITSTDVVDIKSVTAQSTTEESTSILTREDEASGETTKAPMEDVTHELRTATTKLSEEISTHEAEVKLTTFRTPDTKEITKPEIKMITKLPVTTVEETWKPETENQTKVTAILTKETAETETELPKFTTVEVIPSETTSIPESVKFTKQPAVSTVQSTETLKIEEVTHKLPSKSPEAEDEIHKLTSLETPSKVTQKYETEDVAFKTSTKSDTITETPKIFVSEIATEIPVQKVTESILLGETTFKAVAGDVEELTNITTVSQTIKSSETPWSTSEFDTEHPATLKHTEIDSEELETTKYMVEVTSKATTFASLDDSETVTGISDAEVTEKQSIPELITKAETVSEGYVTVESATANATGFEIKITTGDATEIVEGESTSKLTTEPKIYSTVAEGDTPVTSATDIQVKVLTPKITTTGETIIEHMRTKPFADEVSIDIDELSSKYATEISSKVTESEVSTPVITITEREEVSRSTTKIEDSKSTDITKATTKYPQTEDVSLTVVMEKDREELATSSIQTTKEIEESTQSKMTSEDTYTETTLATKGVEVQDVTSNFTLPEISITEQAKTKSPTEQSTTGVDILSTMKSVASEIPETAISDADLITEDKGTTSKLLVFTDSTTTNVSFVQTMEDIGIESTSKAIMKETISDSFETEVSTLQPTKIAASVHTTAADDIKTERPTTVYVTEPAEIHKTESTTEAPHPDDEKQEATTEFTASTEQMEAETQKAETTLDEELEEFKLKLSSQFAPFSDDLDTETSPTLPSKAEHESTAITTEPTGHPVSETPAADEVKITKVEEPSEPSHSSTSLATETSPEPVHTLKHEATAFKLPTTSKEDVGETTGSEIIEVTTRLTKSEETKETEKTTTEISISAETAGVADEEKLIKTRLTTLAEISATEDTAEEETEGVSVISEETILSNRTFAADARLAHSTIAMSTITEASQTIADKSSISDFASSHVTTSPSEISSETTKTTQTLFKDISSITEKVKQDYTTTRATLPPTHQIITQTEISTEKLETTSEQTEIVTQYSTTSKEFISSSETDADVDVTTKPPVTLDSNVTTYAKETPSDFGSVSTVSEVFPSQISTIAAEGIDEARIELDEMQTSSKLANATEKFTADFSSTVSSTKVIFEETSSISTVHAPTETVSEITAQDQTSLDSVSAVSLKDVKDVTSVISTTPHSETTVYESPTTSKSFEVLSEKDITKGETATPEEKSIKEEVTSTLSLEKETLESGPEVSTSSEILELIEKSTTFGKTDIVDFSTSTTKPEIITEEDTTRKISLEDITKFAQPEKVTTPYTEMETEKANVTFEEFSSSATPKILTEGISEISTSGSTEIEEETKSSVTKISTEVLAAEETTKVPDISKSTKFASDEVTEKFITAETKAVETTASVTDTYPEMTKISSTEMQILLEVTTPEGLFSEKEETAVSEFTSDITSKEGIFVDTESASVKLPVSTEIVTEPTAVHMTTTSEIKPDVKVTDDVTMISKTEKTSDAEESSKAVESETTLALETSSASDHIRTTEIDISEKSSIAGVETTETIVSTQLTSITEKEPVSVFEKEKATTISEVTPGKEQLPTTITSIDEGKVSEQTLSSSTDKISITETALPLVTKIPVEDETSIDEKILSTSEEFEKQKTGADMPVTSTTDSRRSDSTVKVTEPTSTVTESTSSTATTPYPETVQTEGIGIAVTIETSERTSTKGLTEKDVPLTSVTSFATPKDVTEAEEGETTIESGCLVNGTMYGDGEAIDTIEPCEKCHCASGDVICFKVICKLPKAGCIPKTTSIDECCPSSYDCPTDGEKVETVTIASTINVTEKDFTTPIPISFMFSSTPTSIASTVLVTKASDQPLPEATIERKEYTTSKEDTDVPITTHVPTDASLETSEKTSERSTIIESTEYSTPKPHAAATESAVKEHLTTEDIRSGTARFIPDAISTTASTATISESEIKTTIELTSDVPKLDVTQSEKVPPAVDLTTEGPKMDETSSLVAEKETEIMFDKVSTTQTSAYSDTDMTEESEVVAFSEEIVATEGKAYPHSTTTEPTKEKEPEILAVTSTEIGNISQEATKLPVTAVEISETYVTYKSTETTGYSEEQRTETESTPATEILSTKLSEDTTNKSTEIYDVKSSTISTTQITERDEIPKITIQETEIPIITDVTGEKEILLKTTGAPATAEMITEKEITLKTTGISAVTDAATSKEISLKPTGVPAITDTTMEKEISFKTTDISAVSEATTEKETDLKSADVSTVTDKTREKGILLETTDVSAAGDITTERELLMKTTGVSVITDETKEKGVSFPVIETEDRIITTTVSDHTRSVPSETNETISEKERTKEMAAEEITPMSTALPSKLPKFDDFVTITSGAPTEISTAEKSFTTETAMEAETTSVPSLKDITTVTKSDEAEELFRDTESMHDIKNLTVITESVSTDAITSTPSGTTIVISSSESFDSATRNITDQMQSEVSDVTSTLSTLHPFISTKLTTVDLATSTDKEVDHVSVTREEAIQATTVPEKLPEETRTKINETRGFDGVISTDVFSVPGDETSTPVGSSTHAPTLTAETSKVPMYIPSLIPQEIDSVTETAQVNQTILSLSKERLSTVSADNETTEEEISATSTEIKLSESSTVSTTTTEKQTPETTKQSVIPKTVSSTIEKDAEIQTSSVEPPITFDHVSTTDKVFTFVSTRFTDVATESVETETPLTTKHDISALNVTDISEKEELRNLTSPSATVPETSPFSEASTKISFTTRKPALKSVDDAIPSVSPYDIDLTTLTEIQEQEELSTQSSVTTLTPAITTYKEADLTKTDISLIETKASEDAIDKSTTVHLAKDTYPASTYDFTATDKETSTKYTSDAITSIKSSTGASSVTTEETAVEDKSTVETTGVEKEKSVGEQFTTYDYDISRKTSETQTEDKIYVANLTTLPEDKIDITFASDNETIITTHRKFEDVTSAAEETTSSPYLKTSIPAISFTTFLDDLNATRKIADESLETISSKDAFETITAKASEQTSGTILTEKAGTITSDIRLTTPFISRAETSTIEKELSSAEVTEVSTQTEVTESTTFGREMPGKVSDVTVTSSFVADIVTEKLSDVTKDVTKIATESKTLVPTPEGTTLEEESLVQNISSVTTKPDITVDITAQSTTVPSKETTVHKITEQAKQDVTALLTKAYKAIETTPTAFTVTVPASEKEEEATAGIEMRKRLPFDDSSEVTDDLVYSTVPEPEDDFLLDEGSCIFEGRIYESAEQIPRADPCEFCFCFRGDIICLQQSCPPPAPNCHRTMIAGYCCPRYDCPVYMTSRNISSLSRRKGVQPIIIQRRIEKREIRPAIEVKGCQVNGTFYEVGSTVTSASGPCLHCMCQDGGIMRCDPQKCKPQAPLMLKMNNSFFRSRR